MNCGKNLFCVNNTPLRVNLQKVDGGPQLRTTSKLTRCGPTLEERSGVTSDFAPLTDYREVSPVALGLGRWDQGSPKLFMGPKT